MGNSVKYNSCGDVWVSGCGGEVMILRDIDRDRIMNHSAAMSKDGLRVLLVASADHKQVRCHVVIYSFS